MIQRIKQLFRVKHKKATISHTAGRILILFFVIILFFTVISRAAQSITIAQVRTEHPRTDRLFYKVAGTGEITLSEEEYLNALPGYRIDKVYVSSGEQVSKDTVLFRYCEEDLLTKYHSIETDMEKIKLQIRQQQLSMASDPEATTQISLLSLQQAEEDLRIAVTNLHEAEAEAEESSQKSRKALLEDKQKEYTAAVKNYESVLFSQEKQLKTLIRMVEDARAELAQTNALTDHIEQVIEDYKAAVLSEDYGSVYDAKEAVFQAFYGSEEAYHVHKDAVLTSALAVEWEKDNLILIQYLITYYDDMQKAAKDELLSAGNSADPMVNSEENIRALKERYNLARYNYIAKQEEYQTKLEYLENAWNDSASELKKLRRNDKKLEEYLTSLQKSTKEAGYETAWKDLYDFLLGEDAKIIEKDLAVKGLALTRAEEDYETLKREHEIKKTDLQAELGEIESIIASMEDGTYDYEEAISGKWQAVKSAKEAVRVAEQAIERSRLQYEAARQNDTDRILLNQKNNQNLELVLQGYQIDLHKKEAELEDVHKLLENSGEIISPYEGIVTFVGLEEGKTAMGEEKIKIGLGDYLYRAEFDIEDADYVKVGNQVTITLAGREIDIETEINEIKINDSGRSELTAILPENNYLLGQIAEFTVTANSDRFDQCIPIQALREDEYGFFILVTREREDILGTVLIAERINVEVIEKDVSTAVIGGALSNKENIITASNKNINSGDKVRLK